MQTRRFKSVPDAVRLIVAKEGFKGLYVVCVFWYSYLGNNLLICNINFYLKRCNKSGNVIHYISFDWQGYSSFLLRDLPFDAIQFCINEQLRIGYNVLVRLVFLPPSHLSKKSNYSWTIYSRLETTYGLRNNIEHSLVAARCRPWMILFSRVKICATISKLLFPVFNTSCRCDLAWHCTSIRTCPCLLELNDLIKL
jgi:hypothetical protein